MVLHVRPPLAPADAACRWRAALRRRYRSRMLGRRLLRVAIERFHSIPSQSSQHVRGRSSWSRSSADALPSVPPVPPTAVADALANWSPTLLALAVELAEPAKPTVAVPLLNLPPSPPTACRWLMRSYCHARWRGELTALPPAPSMNPLPPASKSPALPATAVLAATAAWASPEVSARADDVASPPRPETSEKCPAPPVPPLAPAVAVAAPASFVASAALCPLAPSPAGYRPRK